MQNSLLWCMQEGKKSKGYDKDSKILLLDVCLFSHIFDKYITLNSKL